MWPPRSTVSTTPRLWTYGHIPFYLGVAGVAAGTVAVAGHPDAHGGESWLFAGAAALAMAGVTTVAASHGSEVDSRLAGAWPYYVIALAAAGLPLFLTGWTVVSACLAAAIAQAAVSIRRRRG